MLKGVFVEIGPGRWQKNKMILNNFVGIIYVNLKTNPQNLKQYLTITCQEVS